MNLAEMLGYADIAQLARIAGVYRCECSGHSKHELIQAILVAVSGKEMFDSQLEDMPIEDLRFLNSLLFDSRDAFSLEDLIARARNCSFGTEQQTMGVDAPSMGETLPDKVLSKQTPAGRSPSKRSAKKEKPAAQPGPRDTIARFKHLGWLFNGHSGMDRYLFHVPSDMKQRFKEALARRYRKMIKECEEPHVYRDEQTLLADDMLHLLRYVDQQEIPLTVEGAMYKRQTQQVLELLSVTEELPAKGAWRFGYGRRFKDYPDRLSLLYDFCYYGGLISEADMRLTLTMAGKEKLEGKRREEPLEFYRFWLRLYKGAVPNLAAIVHWIDELAVKWVAIDSLKSELLPLIRPFYYDSAETVFNQRVIMMMLHLGLLRIGEDEQGSQVVRMTAAGQAIVRGVHVSEQEHIRLD
ncbi:hypothetical protein DNH61_23300 [Paenibacillus sambharensis]|uniref:Helicase XPB/Ssl2 N-terminal domain-containing protein n=1 Tax=Paenibacillus sambharensis TaxID=1803190 RepID=A0A2W1L0V2_9BACL|nr:hypothetical protein [Paenibacillus sambharensis]PZD93548.1 hypothetical protein DNH61_23300 [Paenibacillus sambharensis]